MSDACRFVRVIPSPDSRRRIEAAELRYPGQASDDYAFQMQNAEGAAIEQRITFQSQPEPHGINGVTIEGLLEICRDRLEGFQSGPFACEANAEALKAIHEALRHLYQRTAERAARGVEGKLEA